MGWNLMPHIQAPLPFECESIDEIFRIFSRGYHRYRKCINGLESNAHFINTITQLIDDIIVRIQMNIGIYVIHDIIDI